MIDDKTPNLKLPLPNVANELQEDLPRLRQALSLIDTYAKNTDTNIQTDIRAEERKRQLADLVLEDNIRAENDIRSQAVNNLVEKIQIITESLENETAERKITDSVLNDLTGAATKEKTGIARFATLEEALSGVLEGVMINPVDLKEVLKGGGTPKGKIEFLPFRANELPFGYYFCNGDQYPLTSTQGAVLNSLPENYKLDWGITISGGNISLPNMFHTDGRGYFLRAANGTARQAGSIELDDFKSHVHQYYYWEAGMGGFPYGEATGGSGMAYPNTYATGGTETRSINKGMTPAIYLGV